MKKTFNLFVLIAFTQVAFGQKKDFLVTIKSGKEVAHLVLYDETPLHKANFIKLAKKGFYNDLLFHRVIENFMIQGGDPTSKKAKAGEKLGSGGENLERIPYEYNPKRYHKKGTIAAARDNNPEKKSSGSQFYLVQGKKFTDEELNNFEKRNGVTYTAEQRETYKTIGGTPHLDKNYTVFGEIVGSSALVDSVAKVKKDASDRPLEDQKMKISIKKLSKKKITKKFGYQF